MHQAAYIRASTRLHRTLRVGLSGLAIATALGAQIPSASADNQLNPPSGTRGTQPVRSCASLSGLALPGTQVTSATTVAATSTAPEYCNVQVTVNNPPSRDAVHVGVFLPTSTWNGRFVGDGGAGFVAGNPGTPCSFAAGEVQQPCALQAGYATAGTDAGHASSASDIVDGSFALNPDGTLNQQLINDFGYLGIHEMTGTAKAVIAAYYGAGPRYSYFFGDSNGGRQALTEAERYPTDYKGIVAGAPAINWTKVFPSQLWFELVMNWAHDTLPQAKLTAATSAAIGACDGHDGVMDGIISDWQHCRFDARALVGTKTSSGPITATDAGVLNKIWEGPRGPQGEFLWHGLTPGTSLTGLTVTQPDGTTSATMSPLWLTWFQYWVARNPSLDWRTITYDRFLQYFRQSAEFKDTIAADNPNLTAFRHAGGKIVIWHGTYDALIPAQGTTDYYNRVMHTMGGPEKTRQFARLFIAPGAAHAGSGPGPAPADALAPYPGLGSALGAVVDWVENRKAPEQLLGVTDPADAGSLNAFGNVAMTRPICLYPLVARYKGHGNVNDARNFVCSTHF